MNPTIIEQKLPAAGKLAYRVDEACHALGIGRTSLYELIKTGELKIIKIAGRTLVPLSEIERLTSVDRADAATMNRIAKEALMQLKNNLVMGDKEALMQIKNNLVMGDKEALMQIKNNLVMGELVQAACKARRAEIVAKIKVRTEHVFPPIPLREWDWSAVDENTYDGPGNPIGWGRTEKAAIDDLIEQLDAGHEG